MKLLVGIDSDGTAFDSMTIKHRDAFIPAQIKIWNLQDISERVFEIGEKVNLFSKLRGLNRFPGLLKELEILSDVRIGDFSALRDFVNSGLQMSNSGLIKYMETNSDPFLATVLEWSNLSDKIFALAAKGMPPFKNVKETLKKMEKFADLAVISAASEITLKRDWEAGGILKYTSIFMGQEQGSKTKQLLMAKQKSVADVILMIGDSPSDYKAAKEVGAFFYPVIPKHEAKCWKLLHDIYFDKIVEGKYSEEIEQKLLSEFDNSLVTI